MVYGKDSFTKACSVNTLYFWPNPERTARKIAQILIPDGKLVLAFEDIKQLKQRKLNQERDRNFLFKGQSMVNMALCVNIHADTGCCVALLAGIHWQGGLGPKNQMTPFEHLNSHQIWCFF